MKKGLFVAALSLLVICQVAEARRGGRGSRGSWGSCGSCGSCGSYGSYGSCGSSGGWYSHGSYGSYGGSYSSYGSSGWYGQASYVAPAQPVVHPEPPPSPTATEVRCPNGKCYRVTANQALGQKAQLVLHVPAQAQVYLLNQQMTVGGAVRTFNSPKLKEGTVYGYMVRVEYTHNGQKLIAEGKQRVRAGDRIEIEANFDNGDFQIAQKPGQQNVLDFTVTQPAFRLAQN
ncbi:MAG: TIGR03000 domain-containing protein [Planctomycetaceae bacterium]|nr:TIGR03000 domain-containing protein [Planctomycetaceae bacterium]